MHSLSELTRLNAVVVPLQNPNTFCIPVTVPLENLREVLTTVLMRRASDYWINGAEELDEKVAHELLVNADKTITVKHLPHNPERARMDGEWDYTALGRGEILAGLFRMAKHDAIVFADLVAGDASNATADIFMQYAVYGERIFD